MVYPTQLCWRYYSLPLRQQYSLCNSFEGWHKWVPKLSMSSDLALWYKEYRMLVSVMLVRVTFPIVMFIMYLLRSRHSFLGNDKPKKILCNWSQHAEDYVAQNTFWGYSYIRCQCTILERRLMMWVMVMITCVSYYYHTESVRDSPHKQQTSGTANTYNYHNISQCQEDYQSVSLSNQASVLIRWRCGSHQQEGDTPDGTDRLVWDMLLSLAWNCVTEWYLMNPTVTYFLLIS